jgi:hypothetical protein
MDCHALQWIVIRYIVRNPLRANLVVQSQDFDEGDWPS